MMKKPNLVLILSLAALMFVSCSSDDDSSQEQDLKQLEQMFTQIEKLAQSKACEDASEWTFTGIGSKACGEPVTYMAYPTTIDTAQFLQMVEEYNQAQEKYNAQYGIVSDCSVPTIPTEIKCINDKAVLQYGT